MTAVAKERDALQIFLENQSGYFSALRKQGFSAYVVKRRQVILDEFAAFLKATGRVSSQQIYCTATIEAFIKWKIKSRRRKNYHASYRSQIRKCLRPFLKRHARKPRIDFDKLQSLSEKYIQATPPRYPRWPLEVRHKHGQFFTYLKKHRIRDYRKLSPQTIEDFIVETEREFYQSRRRYCSEIDQRVQCGLRAYFRHLADLSLILAALDLDLSTVEATGSFMDEWITRYMDFCAEARGLAPKTLTTRRAILHEFAQSMVKLGVSNLSEIQAHHIDTFVISYGWQVKNMLSLYSAFRRFFKYLYLEREIPHDIASLLLSPKVFSEAHIPNFLTLEELETLFPGKRTDQSPAQILALAVSEILLFTGLRIGEVASLELGDIDWEKKQILIKARKNAHDLLLPLPDKAIEALYEYVTKVRPNPIEDRRIFFTVHAPKIPMTANTLSMSVRRYFHSRGVRGGAHRLRHTCGQNLLESGSSLSDIQGLLGQKTLNSARIYAKTSMNRMRKYVVMDHE